MESNGKRVTRDGEPVAWQTGPIYWGEPGSNGQHSFYQLLHQGTKLVPCDFIGFLEPVSGPPEQHALLLANLFGQAEALALGKTLDEVLDQGVDAALAPHRLFEGNRPSTMLLAERLDPRTLGRLVALYEHAVFIQAAVWQINPFDQWGVELGKQLATRISGELRAVEKPDLEHDPSTNALIERYRAHSRSRS
jgi:glucose-6-phosphate isomerase